MDIYVNFEGGHLRSKLNFWVVNNLADTQVLSFAIKYLNKNKKKVASLFQSVHKGQIMCFKQIIRGWKYRYNSL